MSNDIEDLEEFDVLIDPSFNATSFANDLLLATNTNHNELDISTSIKRTNFDIGDINLKLNKISGEQYENLITEIYNDKETKQLFEKLTPSIDQIKTSYQRLEKDVLTPYQKAIKTQDALKKIHQTSYLLRGVTYFLHIIQQIEELQPTFTNLLKLANLHKQLKLHLVENPELKSIKIIRDYEPIGFDKQRNLIDIIQSYLKSINEKSINTTSHEELINIFQAFHTLDQYALYNFLNNLISQTVIVSVNSLTRVLTSPRNIDHTLLVISEKAIFLNKISSILSKIFVSQNAKKVSLLDDVLENLETINFLTSFWRDVARKFEVKFKETILRGGPVAKALISYKDQIRTSIKKAVLQSDPDLKPDGVEVRMMLNSVISLDRTK